MADFPPHKYEDSPLSTVESELRMPLAPSNQAGGDHPAFTSKGPASVFEGNDLIITGQDPLILPKLPSKEAMRAMEGEDKARALHDVPFLVLPEHPGPHDPYRWSHSADEVHTAERYIDDHEGKQVYRDADERAYDVKKLSQIGSYVLSDLDMRIRLIDEQYARP